MAYNVLYPGVVEPLNLQASALTDPKSDRLCAACFPPDRLALQR